MIKFEPFNSTELNIIKDVFNELCYLQLDINIANIIESYIYTTVREYYPPELGNSIRSEYRKRFDVKDGEYKMWHSEGKDNKIMIETIYTDGKLNGEYKYWYSNGQLGLQATYLNGEINGVMTRWHQDSGEKSVEATYKDGVIVGKMMTYYNGKTRYI